MPNLVKKKSSITVECFFVFKICQPFALKNLPIAILFFPTQETLRGSKSGSQQRGFSTYLLLSHTTTLSKFQSQSR
jgi:hypothetical protein